MSRLTKLSKISSDLPLLIWYDYLKLICSNEKIKNHKSKSILHRDSFWNLLTFLLKKRHLISKSLFFQFKTFFSSRPPPHWLKRYFLHNFLWFYKYPNYLYNLNQCAIKFRWLWMWHLFCLFLSTMHGVFNKVMWKYDGIKKK